MTQKCITISEIEDLTCINDKSLCKIFKSNIDVVFGYDDEDILKVLDQRNEEVIKTLRDELSYDLKGIEMFATYANKTPNETVIRNTMCSDIITLGRSISQKADRNLVSVFQEEPQLDLTDTTQLINFVLQLKDKYDNLEAKYLTLKHEKISLDTRVTFLESKLGKFDESSLKQNDTPDIIVDTDSVSDLGLNTTVPESVADDHLANDPVLLPTTPEVIANPDAKPKPVKAGPKPAYAYIGGVDPDIDCNDIMFHINTFSNVKIKQGDVQIEPIRFGSNRSFKVAVPQEKLHEITQNKYLW